MSEATIDVIGQVSWWGIFASPVIAFFIVGRSRSLSTNSRWAITLLLTFIIAFIFFIIAWSILLRHGLGPG